jgi:hypothetical protein
MEVKAPGYEGPVVVLPEEKAAELKDGAAVVTSKILKAGALLEANWEAKPRATSGQPDYTKVPVLVLSSITVASADPFGS